MENCSESCKEIASLITKANMVTSNISGKAKAENIVIVYGHSDELMEFEGAIRDEVGCYDGGKAYLTPKGLFEVCECDCVHAQRALKKAKSIQAIWCGKDTEFTWTYKTDIPHEKFQIIEDDEKYCEGICFDISQLG